MTRHDKVQAGMQAGVSVAVSSLKDLKAPTSVGYNDMAVMIAFGNSGFGAPVPVSADMISHHLKNYGGVPQDARMEPGQVQKYLDTIYECGLIEHAGGKYVMPASVGEAIHDSYEAFKSSHINGLMFSVFSNCCEYLASKRSG